MSRLSVKVDQVAALVRNIKALVKTDVLVGVPADEAARGDEAAMNNATLAYIHDNGSPAANIPPRPFMAPGIHDAQEQIERRLKQAARAGTDGKRQKSAQELAAAGLVAQNSIKAKINSGDFDPLADATLEARARRTRGRKGALAELASRAAGNAPGTEFAKPLIDTGQMRNSITYVVRKKS